MFCHLVEGRVGKAVARTLVQAYQEVAECRLRIYIARKRLRKKIGADAAAGVQGRVMIRKLERSVPRSRLATNPHEFSSLSLSIIERSQLFLASSRTMVKCPGGTEMPRCGNGMSAGASPRETLRTMDSQGG